MIQTGIESRVKIQDIVSNQLPEFILDESPKVVDFLKQYYISQEYQGGPVDIGDNLDQYLRLDNLTPEVIVDNTTLSSSISNVDTTINVSSTKGFPNQYGLLKINDEIITYTGITTNSFIGCVRGFSGITNYHQDTNREELIFETSSSSEHNSNTSVQNLSSLFLKEFYKKLKSTFTPGLENVSFDDEIDAGNFIRRAKDFYASKGTDQAIKILFSVIFGEIPSVINLEDYLIKPSSANYVRREVAIAEVISGEATKIVGQTLIKTTDKNTSASISSVEPFTRKGKSYYKIEFYIGNDGKSSVEGNFIITPNTKLIEDVSVGDSILTVDSTLNFPESGTLISGNDTISYTSKTINQFFGCSGISTTILSTSNVRSNDTYYSYEDGDISKKVEIILLGVIQDLVEETEDFKVSEGDIVTIKNLGDKIRNNNSNPKEIFTNSFIYNTSARYQITDNDTNQLGSDIDKSSLKVGDEVEVLERGSEISTGTNTYIQSIDTTANTLNLQNKPNLDTNKKYDVRRKLNKTSSSGYEFENASLVSDILNVYVDGNEYAYVASNSVPSRIRSEFTDNGGNIIKNYRHDIPSELKSIDISSSANLQDDVVEGLYNTINIDGIEHPFLTGDLVYYFPDGEPLVGLDTGTYYTERVSNKKFKLFNSQSLIESGNNIKFQIPSSGMGTHTFILNSQKDIDLGIQKLLRKFPLGKNIEKESGSTTVPGTVGMLINGVEISNYKSNDVIYYGPIEGANILSEGNDYDVINPPGIDVSVGNGDIAKIQPVVSGKFEKVYVDIQDYNIDKISSIDISGGNGSGAVIDPVLVNKPRDVLFNADEFSTGGGVSENTNQIVFLTDHNFINGEEIVYNSLGNNPILLESNKEFPNNSTYFVEVTNNKTIKLYYNLPDQQSGINTVGIYTGSSGVHKFSTSSSKKQIEYIKIINGGEGYTNRKLIVKSSGISTSQNSINFKNHGFSNGEIIEYSYETSSISGLSTANQYYVLKIDDDSFRLCNAGIGGTIYSNYERKKYEKFDSTGSGYQYFKYPDISVSIKYNTVGFGTTTQSNEELVLTPVVKGSIVDAYVYESGTGYGSTILNFKKNPVVTILNGKSAQLTPNIIDGKIISVSISYGGSEYYSTPNLTVSGSGTGAELRSIINNGQITEVKVLNSGSGYSQLDTKIKVISSGKNALIDPQIRKLTLNNNVVRFANGEVLNKGKDKLQYSVSKYFEDLRNSFLEDGSLSGIIGWAYDGNPIYGPYGYNDPSDKSSGKKTLQSGYTLNTSNVIDRPSGFDGGFFVEDYQFDGTGDLDESNGRYEKNNEYPNGVYAYHATIDQFPYFIGNKYRSKLISDSDLNQSFDFNNSNLLRNTLPYKVSEIGADYDFFNETSDILDQKIEVLSTTSDSIQSIEIKSSGNNYKVGDTLEFDETGTSGSGLDVAVESIKGRDVVDVSTSSTLYSNSIFTWDSFDKVKVSILPNHNLSDNDYITISGFSTNLSSLNGTHKISVPKYANGRCLSTISSASVGFTTEIYVAPIPEQISIGSSISIGTETLRVLGIFKNENILRIERSLAGVSHTVGTAVSFLPDSFTISKSLDKFESKIDDKVFFNPKESVGVSTINGVGYSTSFTFGNISTVNRSIPSKGIYIDNHPFKTNQPVTYVVGTGTTLIVSTDGLIASEVFIDTFPNLFIVNKNPNLIGLKTSINGEELYFHSNGDDNDIYSLESNSTQILGDVEKNEVTVSVSTSHNLQLGDNVSLNVKPGLSVGIGNSTSVRVLYKSNIGNIVVNPIEFNSSGIDTTTDEITITEHNLKTGDKVLYEDSGFEEYFVYKVNTNKFKLCETHFDSQQNPPVTIDFTSSGGSSQFISLINPEINPIKNNDLVFDLSDSSLSGYKFKIFTDNEFNNEFISTGSTNTFNVSGVGTVGTDASLTLKYSSQIPEELYYTLEKDGVLLYSDMEIENYSSIKYKNSTYDGSYSIVGIGTTTFNIIIDKKPESLSYSSSQCDILEYSTSSTNESGPINSFNILSTGSGYKKLPTLKSVNSVSGSDLIINLKSNKIGSIKETKVVNNRFTYSSDKTLRPKVNASPNLTLKDFSTIDQISIINGGDGYTTSPTITLVNPTTRDEIQSGLINAKITGSSISSVEILVQPKGLPDDTVEVFTTNNSNGISIEKVESIDSVTFDCTISTPISGFSTQPFYSGDQVFIEGIQKTGDDGDGFNSSDLGYKFLNVDSYDDSGVNDKVRISVSGLTTNTGSAKVIQDFSGVIINKTDYPVFNVSQKESEFFIGEKLSSNGISRDLVVTENGENSIKVLGSYELSLGEVIIGNQSGSIATIESLSINEGYFNVGYSNLKNIGWDTEIGKLSEDYQVLENNDYYQNLSYSIKSSITYNDQQSPVENLVHTSGLKNFADTQISQNVTAGTETTDDGFVVIYDVIDEKRVDTINNFDNVIDVDVVDSKSKFLKLQNKKLTDYTTLKNLNVLKIDDISNQFSNSEAENTEFLTIEEVDDELYYNYLIRVVNEDNNEIQLTDITILSDGVNTSIVENESLYNSSSPFGSFDIDENEFDETFLKFYPNDPFNKNYDVKIIRQVFNTTSAGVGTTSIGLIDLTGSVIAENTAVGVGTTTLISLDSSDVTSLYINTQIINEDTLEMNYVRLYITHNDTDSFMSEYYIDNTQFSFTGDFIGSFRSELSGGVLSILYENDSTEEIKIRSNIVGFGTTALGAGIYRFKSSDQSDGQERSATYNATYYSTVGAAVTTVHSLDNALFNASKSLIQVSIGSTKALHQVMMISDGTNVYTQQLPILSASNTEVLDDASGIGTFGGEISGSNLLLKFYPDSEQTGQIDIEVFNRSLYSDLDILNDYNDFTYGSVTESIDEKFYNAINLNRINKTNFKLTSDNIPIFSKQFNPNSSSLVANTGIFTIPNHYFMTGEELIYTANSSVVGVATSAIETPSGDLPSTVYAIKLSEDTFKVATTLNDAQSGIGVTFTSLGGGNAHRFTMSKRNSKCMITVDKLVQYPIAFTGIEHSLSGNIGGTIGDNTTIVSLSGISSIRPRDILLIGDEYMGVTNVGLGTTNIGPITNVGSINLVEVDRGFVGSSASSHTDGSLVNVYRGSFNIVDDEIHFSEAPRGNPQIDKTKYNLDYETSSFTGLTFLRSDYSDNKVYDDISDQFTGIGRTFTLTVGGANTTGIGTFGGSGFAFVNNIYQSPKTQNNPSEFNYEILEDSIVGISTIEFSGITKPDIDPLEYITSDYDINVNETPRGGIIVSYGSTPGLGFAPLVGASITAVLGAGGSIVGITTGLVGGTYGSGYNGLTSIGVTVYDSTQDVGGDPASITAVVGAGGSLSFNIGAGGTGYNNPQIFVSDPSYKNLPIIGVSRLGIGATTETGNGLLIDLKVGGSTGIGSTYFEVTEVKFSRPGYAFRKGDVFKPVGLVTDASLSSPLSEFTITVVDTYTDNFAAWEFGELDYIDSIKEYQNGTRTRFPLFYNSELLSIEPEQESAIGKNINNTLIIFINGILQEPVTNYVFEGGTSFAFTRAPLPEDDIEIYFYRGTKGVDSESGDVKTTIERGDIVQVISNNIYPDTITQDERTVYDISSTDTIETNGYSGLGINETDYKPISWTKQKTERKINGEYTYKSRDSLEAVIHPAARIIKDVLSTDTEIFVDNSELFNYESGSFEGGSFSDTPQSGFSGLIVNGISTEANNSVENITGFTNISGFSGIITGITTTTGTGGNPLALEFNIIHITDETAFAGFSTGYPIYIYDTQVGNGVTSIDSSDTEVIGIGTICFDNVYYVSDWSYSSIGIGSYIGIITCNVKSDSDIIGISTTGNLLNPIGKYSWGRLSSGTRSTNPISIGVSGNIVSGLSTYPTVQRRGFGFRKTGALPKIVL